MSYSEEYAKRKLEEMDKKEKAEKDAKVVARIIAAIIFIPIFILIIHFIIWYNNRPLWQKELGGMSNTQLLKVAKQYYLTDSEKYAFIKNNYNVVCQLDPSSTKIGMEAEEDVSCKFANR